MTHEENINALDVVLQPIIENGSDGIVDVFAAVLNIAMRIEREQYLKAGSYERTYERVGHANGYKPKQLKTRMGSLDVKVPPGSGELIPFIPVCWSGGSEAKRLLSWPLRKCTFRG